MRLLSLVALGGVLQLLDCPGPVAVYAFSYTWTINTGQQRQAQLHNRYRYDGSTTENRYATRRHKSSEKGSTTDEHDDVNGTTPKFSKLIDESTTLITPLPEYLKEQSSEPISVSPLLLQQQQQQQDNIAISTQQLLRQQQEQIELLIKTLQSQAATTPVTPITTTITNSIPPLKVMLFIDGTWLYYSIFERPKKACPISQQYDTASRPWYTTHKVDWAAIPSLVAECLTQQEQKSGWTQQPRTVSIERAFCFTSYKKDTSPTSNRVRMFEDMKDANYDVFIMDTMGPGEKCVDIQLAVEMMHYATIPDAYDVAVLISGDKDFLPALLRTRQKARNVALVSMRTACNRALYETPNALDYDVIWMEDYIDRWVVEKDENKGEGDVTEALVSSFTILKVIYDYIANSGMQKVSSRDIGRYLKSMEIGSPGKEASLLDQVKILGGGLFRFLVYHKEYFEVTRRSPKEEKAGLRNDAGDRAFGVFLNPFAGLYLAKEEKEAKLSKLETDFFESYNLDRLRDKDEEYPLSRTMLMDPKNSRGDTFKTNQGIIHSHHDVAGAVEASIGLPMDETDYSKFTIVNLKELCRERGLKVTGSKAILVERIIQDNIMKVQAQNLTPKPIRGSTINHESQIQDTPESRLFIAQINEYLTASGGEASSRDVGRYLAAAPGLRGRGTSALTELKEAFVSLRAFVDGNQAHFYRAECDLIYEFRIGIQK